MDSELKPVSSNDSSVRYGWFCVRSHPKREHIAAAHLRQLSEVEVFNPRLRIKKPTRRGIVTFIESLFPNYLFARFDVFKSLEAVKHSPSVSTVVHFGNRVPLVPDEVIAELQTAFAEGEIQDVEREINPGDEVVIGDGPFAGMKAKVLRVLTPHQRIEVLLEMLGRSTPVIVNPLLLKSENDDVRPAFMG